MKWNTIKTLLKKDLSLFFKNRFFSAITVLGLVVYIALYFVVPKSVDDTMKLAIYTNIDFSRATQYMSRENAVIIRAKSIDELKNLVLNNEVIAGYVFPDDLVSKMLSAYKPPTFSFQIYTSAEIEPEMREALEYIGKEMIFTQFGFGLNVESKNEVLGPDLATRQIPPSKRIIPVFALFLIITETLGIANLIADEFQRKTIHAVLATPSTISEIFVAKGLMGLTTTLIPAIMFITVTVGFSDFPLLFVLLLCGSILTISIGFIVGSIGRDFLSVIAWGALFFIILIIPAFNVIAPGTLTSWVKAIPSFYLIDTVHRVINFGAGFKESWKAIGILLSSSAVFFAIGSLALRRRTG